MVSSTRAEHEDGGFIDKFCNYDFILANQEVNEVEQPKTWAHLTDAEKGALLLSHHNGEVIECWVRKCNSWVTIKEPNWESPHSYRVKPVLVIEEKEEKFGYDLDAKMFLWTAKKQQFKLTYRLVDGILDEDSVKVVRV